jgi:4-diphosphocytidyl-2-C-methyl-D-erythritol kinase
MVLRRTPAALSILAPAKLNLTLEVRGQRSDGYHDLKSLMVPLRWSDSLRFEPLADTSRLELVVTGPAATPDIPRDSRNLVLRALELVRDRRQAESGARVTLVKRVPSQAGLGGGSSDAAAALVAGAAMWRDEGRDRTPITTEELADLAGRLGSDVPFFAHAIAGGARAAICRGRGEIVDKAPGSRCVPCVVVNPGRGLSTAAVFAEVAAADRVAPGAGGAGGNSRAAAEALQRLDWRGLQESCGNALGAAAERLEPVVAKVLASMRRLAVPFAQVTGSGSACFALCRSWAEARTLASRLRACDAGVVTLTATC